MSSASPYRHLGGSLPLEDSTYVTRQADQDLYDALGRGEFCYVLTSRQMGKSSLRVRVMQQLQTEGKACGVVDLSAIGTDVSAPAWYKGIAYRILRNFRQVKSRIWKQWWNDHEFLSPVQQLSECIDEVLLDAITEEIVLFIDEIDSVLSCGFDTDDFFSWIRACYNRRVDEPQYCRLTFCLIGVAAPNDLIADKQRTPFNIGRAIALEGFGYEQARYALEPGLTSVVDRPDQVLKEILTWTGGQPFLTQKVCQIISSQATSRRPDVKAMISAYIIQDWESHDEPEHLKTIRDRLYRNPDKTSRLLGLYQQILMQGKLALTDTAELRDLQLTGLVAKHGNSFVVFNPIYQTIFNLRWVEQALSGLRPYALAFQAWVDAGQSNPTTLIQGKELAEAKAWAIDKSLSDQDYTYLAACQEEAQQRVEENLEMTAQSKERLEVANAQANRRIRWGMGVLGLAGIIFGGTMVVSGRMVNEAQIDAAKAREEAQFIRQDSELMQQEAQSRVQQLEEESALIAQSLQGSRLARQKVDQELKQLQDNLKRAKADIQFTEQQMQQTQQQAQILEAKNKQLQDNSAKLRQEFIIAQRETQAAKLASEAAKQEVQRATAAEVLALKRLQETQLQAERAQYLSFSLKDEPWVTAFQADYRAALNSQAVWVSEPKAIALRLLGYPNPDGCQPGDITLQNGINANHVIVIIRSPTEPLEYCADDSVIASEHRIDLVKDQAIWNLEWVGGRFRCHGGFGGRFPEVFVAKRCI